MNTPALKQFLTPNPQTSSLPPLPSLNFHPHPSQSHIIPTSSSTPPKIPHSKKYSNNPNQCQANPHPAEVQN